MIYLYNELLVVFVHAFHSHSEVKVFSVSSGSYQTKAFFKISLEPFKDDRLGEFEGNFAFGSSQVKFS